MKISIDNIYYPICVTDIEGIIKTKNTAFDHMMDMVKIKFNNQNKETGDQEKRENTDILKCQNNENILINISEIINVDIGQIIENNVCVVKGLRFLSGAEYSQELIVEIFYEDNQYFFSFVNFGKDVQIIAPVTNTTKTIKDVQMEVSFETSLSPTFIIDDIENIIDVNSSAVDMVGYSKEELKNMRHIDLIDGHQPISVLIGNDSIKIDNKYLVYTKYIDKNKRIINVILNIIKSNNLIKCSIIHVHDMSLESVFVESMINIEKKFKLAFDNAPVGMCIVDSSENIINVNQTIIDITGYSQEELIDMHYQQLTRDGISIKNLLETMADINRDNDNRIESIYRHKSGTLIDVIVSVTLIRDKNFDTTGYYYILHIEDITKQKVFTTALAEERNLLRTLIDSLPDTVYFKDVNHKFILNNKSHIAPKTGLISEQLIGKSDFDILPKDRAQSYWDAEERVIKNGESILNEEELIIDESGNKHWTISSKIPIRKSDGEIMGLVGISRDITERKLSEEKLRDSEILFRVAFENSPIGMALVALDGKLLHVNNSLVRKLGYSQDELIKMDYQSITHPDDLEADNAYVKKLVDGEMNSYQMEKRYIKKSGDILWALLGVSVVRDNHNQPVHFISQVVNISELKNLINEYNTLNIDLKRSNAELEQFAYIASHGLQEPIRVISNYIGLIAKRYKDNLDEDGLEFMKYITDSSKRIQNLINDLLLYSRVGRRVSPSVINLNTTLLQVIDNLKIAIDESGAAINYPEMPTVYGDSNELLRLFQNLIGNAIKFRNGRVPSIQIEYKVEGNFYYFTIRDNGIGIDELYYEKIFLIFQRLHAGSEYPGTGVGLALCKRIVESYGGKIGVISKVGEGSTFWFTLPVLKS